MNRISPTSIPTGKPGTHEHLMTLDEVRTLLRISKWSLYQLVNNGQLRTITIGRRRLVAPADFDQLIANLREERGHRGW